MSRAGRGWSPLREQSAQGPEGSREAQHANRKLMASFQNRHLSD